MDSEEAGFIAAMLAEPDDRTTLLVYADWLDERGAAPRAEYLRVLSSPEPDWQRLVALQQVLDTGWTQLIGLRRIGVGERSQYRAPADADGVLDETTVTADRRGATVRLTVRRRPGVAAFGWWELEVRARHRE